VRTMARHCIIRPETVASIVSVQSNPIRLAIICRIAISACIARRFQFLARLTMSDSVP
jgi:hypothetical protein